MYPQKSQFLEKMPNEMHRRKNTEANAVDLCIFRFMQTFVLAPQSPKKYYVINDIFRYQVLTTTSSFYSSLLDLF